MTQTLQSSILIFVIFATHLRFVGAHDNTIAIKLLECFFLCCLVYGRFLPFVCCFLYIRIYIIVIITIVWLLLVSIVVVVVGKHLYGCTSICYLFEFTE